MRKDEERSLVISAEEAFQLTNNLPPGWEAFREALNEARAMVLAGTCSGAVVEILVKRSEA